MEHLKINLCYNLCKMEQTFLLPMVPLTPVNNNRIVQSKFYPIMTTYKTQQFYIKV